MKKPKVKTIIFGIKKNDKYKKGCDICHTLILAESPTDSQFYIDLFFGFKKICVNL